MFLYILFQFIRSNLQNQCLIYNIPYEHCINSIYVPQQNYDNYIRSFNMPIRKDPSCNYTNCLIELSTNPNEILIKHVEDIQNIKRKIVNQFLNKINKIEMEESDESESEKSEKKRRKKKEKKNCDEEKKEKKQVLNSNQVQNNNQVSNSNQVQNNNQVANSNQITNLNRSEEKTIIPSPEKYVTLVQFKTKTMTKEKPLTLYRELVKTVEKEIPIINYKVKTITDIEVKTKTVFFDEKKKKGENRKRKKKIKKTIQIPKREEKTESKVEDRKSRKKRKPKAELKTVTKTLEPERKTIEPQYITVTKTVQAESKSASQSIPSLFQPETKYGDCIETVTVNENGQAVKSKTPEAAYSEGIRTISACVKTKTVNITDSIEPYLKKLLKMMKKSEKRERKNLSIKKLEPHMKKSINSNNDMNYMNKAIRRRTVTNTIYKQCVYDHC